MIRRLFAAVAAVTPALIAGALPASGQNAYITNGGSNTVSVIATASGAVVGSPIGVGSSPYGVAIAPDASKVYVANSGSNTVSVIATASNTVIATITVGASPVGLAMTADGGTVYAANSGANTVSVIATASNTVTATIAVGTNPSGVTVTPDGSKVYVANTGDGTVSLILTSLNAATAAIPVGAGPLGLAVSPDGSTLYVANKSGDSVSVIPTAGAVVSATIAVGLGPAGIAVTPDGSTVYVADSITNLVSVIGTAKNTVTATVTVGNAPLGVAVTPDGGKVFVVNQGDATVSVIATAGNTVIGSPIAVGAVPAALGSFISPVRATPGLAVTPTAYATQAVAAASGALTITGGVALVSSVFTTGSVGGTATAIFTLPAGVTFSTAPTATVDGTAFTAATLSGGGGTNSISISITLGSSLFLRQGTLTLSSFQIAGATALATPTASGFVISEQITGSIGATPSLNQVQPVGADLATSASALSFSAVASPGVTIDVLSPGYGTRVSQPVPIGTTDAAWADLGTLYTGLVAGLENALATGQFTFTGDTLAVTLAGNFTGLIGAYVAPAGTTTCATTFAAQPSGAVDGSLLADTLTFSTVGAGLSSTAGGSLSQEVCVYFTGTTIIGQNPSGLSATGSVDTTTQTTAPLAAETYNGNVQQIQYSGNFTVYPEYIRIVNNNAGPIQALALVQGDSGSTGQTTVETALAGNSNDVVPATTILTNAGVTLPSSGRGSIILLAPNGVVFSQLMQQPGGLVDNIQ